MISQFIMKLKVIINNLTMLLSSEWISRQNARIYAS